MAATTYSVPVSPPDRAVEVMVAVANHLVAWKQIYGIDMVSIVRNGPVVDFTFSDPLPLAERQAIRATVT